jgi:murein DD-endopeptidase MepM/ murein hydrolase activator NlpD
MRVFQRVILPILSLLLAVAVVYIVVYLIGGPPNRAFVRYNAPPTIPPPLPGTPVARFEQVNPAILQAYALYENGYDPAEQDLFSFAVQPIGNYLPRSGDNPFVLNAPTEAPTPFPYPTTPPLPIPGIPGMIMPTLVPTSLVETEAERTVPVPLEIEWLECAPAGLPVSGPFTQRFHRYHLGVDIGVRVNTPVVATHSGQVVYADWNPIGYGYLVILQSGPFITYYAHNTSFNVVQGQTVGKGSILAWSGNTGNSTGPHVHYETRVNDINVDPLTFENRGYGTC